MFNKIIKLITVEFTYFSFER